MFFNSFDFEEIEDSDRYLARFFIIMYQLLVMFILRNIFIGIL